MNVDDKKIGKFLKSLNKAELIYMKHCMDLTESINRVIDDYDLSKEYVCEAFQISTRKYNDFVSGNFEYTMRHMATLNALFMEHEQKKLQEQLKEEVPVQIKRKDAKS